MFKKLVAPVLVAGALLGSLAVGGIAQAATPTSTSAPATHTGAHPGHKWLKEHRKDLRKSAIAVSASTIGVTPQALVTELKSGKSIAQVAAEHNISASTVESALVTAADGKVAQGVSARQITQAQADKITAALPARITKLVNHVF
ncbi:MAG TPA: hypothetical protein VII96_07230 [Acidimicrobiales bacterium]